MEEGTIVKWHKHVGDYAEAGDLLFEVATDKATVEYNALDSGWLKKIIVGENQEAKVNTPVAIFTEQKEESIEGYKWKEEPVVAASLPSGVKSEEAYQEAAPLQKLEKRAAAMQQPAFIPEQPLKDYEFQMPSKLAEKHIQASPLARRIAKEKKLDLSTVRGTGPGHRIVSRDLEKAQPEGAVVFGKREAPKLAPGTFEEEVMTPMRKIIGQRLQESKSFIPHFYVTKEIDAEPLVVIREQLKNVGLKVTVNDLIVRACALALREHPNINSGFNSVNNTFIRFKTIDISIAVSVKGGLVTPIVRHADFKNLGEISLEVQLLAKKAKEGKLEPYEYKGGSFTISNLGMYGVSDFQAIINPPQAAILAVSGIIDRPVIKNGQIVPGKVMGLSLSSDHRVIDGVAAAEFLLTLKKYLESPAALLI